MTDVIRRLILFDRLASPNFSIIALIASGLSLLFAYNTYFSSTFFFFSNRRRPSTPRLKGPSCTNPIVGLTADLFLALDVGELYHGWENRFGQVYGIPSTLGSQLIVLGDPKAISHVFARDTYVYQQSKLIRILSQLTFGDVLIVMEGDVHKRQRRALSNAFSISAIRILTSEFLSSAYKLTKVWDATLVSESGSATIDVQKWMNCVSIDSIGNGGFSHDFGALRGEHPPVVSALEAFGGVKASLAVVASFVLGIRFPWVFARIPTRRRKALKELARSVRGIANGLLEKAEIARRDPETEKDVSKSIIGTLVKAENASSAVNLSVEEIMAQINLLIIAGYETTSVSLTWALIELVRNPETQSKLRAELLSHYPADDDREPTYDELVNNLPYLDAVTCEILRLHPAVPEITRVANEDDTIPLTQPVLTSSGTLIDSLFVKKGTRVRIPVAGVNRSRELWGADAGVFDPERWLVVGGEDGSKSDSDSSSGAVEVEVEKNRKSRKDAVQGYRHLLSFGFGPRMCLGRNFALAEFKAVLSVIVRKYSFESPFGNGKDLELDSHLSILRRPKVAGMEGPQVPLLVRKVE